MEQIEGLATALAIAQGEIQNAEKQSENPFYHSKYADLSTVLNCIRSVFAKNGLSIVQIPSYEMDLVTVKTIIMHKSGQAIEGSLTLPVSKKDAQGIGSAITYARRYSISAMAGITQEDDDANSAIAPVKKPEDKKAEQLDKRTSLLATVGKAKIALGKTALDIIGEDEKVRGISVDKYLEADLEVLIKKLREKKEGK